MTMAYVALYRKWRPQNFEEVLGQEYVTRTLANSLRNGNFSHAYLFTGPRGTGKTSTARILAKALNCEEGPTPNPCNRCAPCREITEGTSVDVVEVDAASNRGIDDIRDLRERVVFSPASARIKVYILDEAHMLTKEAFNAFLKTLEEPPQHVVFVLATTEPHKMPQTILSRCQRYDFRGVSAKRLAEHLAVVSEREGIRITEKALRLLARRAKGSARDALVLLEQVASYGDGEVDEAGVAGFLGMVEDELLVELGDRLAAGDAAGALAVVERAYEEGKDLAQFARGAREHFRKVLLLQQAGFSSEELEVDEEAYASMREQSESIPAGRLHHFIAALAEAEREMRSDSSPRLLLESALVGMAVAELDPAPEAILARVERLEGELERMARRGALSAAEAERPAAKAPPAAPRGTAGAGKSAEKPPDAPSVERPPERREEAAGRPYAEQPAGMPLDVATVKRSWPQIRERVKERKITVHALLLEGRPAEVEGGELVLSFPPERSFHRGEMEKDANKEVLEAALEEVLGVGLKVTTRLEEGSKGVPRPPAGREKEKAAERVEREREVPAGKAAAPAEEPGTAKGSGPEREAAEKRGPAETEEEEEEAPPETAPDRERGEPERTGRRGPYAGAAAEGHDAGRVKLVKDIFGAEVIEEITLGE
ncbi:MAG: DNA polymerase III subunit gamma/tau [Actinomycetota bacterium]|nr:DNA polymerase III subunit gamma/tau [Actinomycetota bacterium]